MILTDQWVEAVLSGPGQWSRLISTLLNLFTSFLNHRSYINSVINTGYFQRRAKTRESVSEKHWMHTYKSHRWAYCWQTDKNQKLNVHIPYQEKETNK